MFDYLIGDKVVEIIEIIGEMEAVIRFESGEVLYVYAITNDIDWFLKTYAIDERIKRFEKDNKFWIAKEAKGNTMFRIPLLFIKPIKI